MIAALILASVLAAECPLEFDGERADVERLRAAWRAIAAPFDGDRAGCTPRRVFVSAGEGGWSVELIGTRGRRRVVGSVEVAALLVESWSHAELLSLIPPLARAVRAPIVPERAKFSAIVPAPARTDRALEVSAELGHDGGALWLGAAAKMRARWDELEPLILLRATHASEDGTQPASRIGVALLAGIARPIELDSVTLSLGIAAGVGWMQSARRRVESCGAVCPPVITDGFTASTFGVHLEPHVAARFAIQQSLALELALSADIAPFAHRDTFFPDYAREASLSNQERELLSIPGEPLLVVRLGAGVRWEGP